jgi:NAD(P)-dependent dehydrogenase (short-subunit alcohol dehydrogenase family)
MSVTPIVLITGAAGGLGRAVVKKFLTEGWAVIAADVREIIAESATKDFLALKLDVTDMAQIESARNRIKSDFGRMDVLVNAAGILDFYPLSEAEPDLLKSIFDVNTFGPVSMIRAFLPFLIESKGRVINISSESIKFPGAFQPYQASKLALEALHKALRQELFLKGVKMIAIRPGAIDTEMTAGVSKATSPVRDSIYENEFGVFASEAAKFIGKKMSPKKVAYLIFKAATVPKPRYYYQINHSVRLTLLSMLPEKVLDRLTRILYQKKGKG